MRFYFTPYLLPSLLAALIATGVVIYVRRRRVPGAVPFALLMLAIAEWSASQTLETAGVDLLTKQTWHTLKYFGIAAVPLMWLLFILQYTGYRRLLTRRWLVVWSAIPIATVLLIVTNGAFHLMWGSPDLDTTGPIPMLRVDYGIGFWVYAAYSYTALAIGTALLLMILFRVPQIFRAQTAILLFGVITPWVANAMFIFDLDPVPHLDLTVFAHAIGGLVLSWALYRNRLFDLIPVAREAVIEGMYDGMVVLDLQGRVVDCNPAARRLLSQPAGSLIGRTVHEILTSRQDLIVRYHETADVHAEMQLNDRICDIRISALRDRYGQASGRLMVLRDITASRRAEEALRHSQAQLSGVINTAQDAIITLNSDQQIIMFNAGAERIFGVTAAEIIGQTPDRLIPDQFRERHSRQVQAFGQTGITTRVMGVGEVRALRVNGEEFPAEASISRATVGGQVYYTVILRDITTRKQADDELRRQEQLFENLVAVARATTARPDLEDTLRNVLRVGVRLTWAVRGSLFLFDADGAVTHAVSVRDSAPLEERRAAIGRVMNHGLVGWTARNKRPVLIRDTRDDDRWLPLSEGAIPTRSALAVPIMSGQTLLGVLMLLHSDPGHFTDEHLRLMQAAVDQMALAVRNARSFESQRRMAERQTTLYEILRTVGSQLDRDTVARTAAEAISLFTGWQNVAVIVPDDDQQRWVVRAVSGTLPMTIGLSFPIEQGIIGRALTAGRVQNIGDVRADPDFLFPDSTARSKLVVPMRRGERVLGVLNIDSDHPNAFDAEDVSQARSLADAVALALDNAGLYQVIADERSRLQALIKSSRDGIALMGMNLRVLVVNAPALQLLGMPDQPDQWLGRSVIEALQFLRHRAPQVVKTIRHELRRIRTGEEPPSDGEYTLHPHVVHWISLPVLSGTAPLGRLVVLRDVTEERSLAAMRDDLTGTMVHDLRNPLTILQSSLELLDSEVAGETSSAQRQILDVMQQGVDRMLNLVTAILDVNRLESGQMPLEREPIQLQTLVNDVLEMQAVLATEKRLRLACEIESRVPAVSIDVDLVRRVFQNLIGNAIKFTPSDGRICVTAQIDPSDSRLVEVSVQDSGPGVPIEMQARLFQKFVTGRVRGRGSGLGLAFCRLVVEAHGGRIWVESETGAGATFKFTLPAVL